MRRLLIIAGIILGLLVVAAVALPLFINVDTFRPELEKRMSAALNRPVHIGKLEASIFSGGASASDISIADDPAFNRDPFLKANTVKVGLHLMPLIFSRRMEVTSVTVKNPDIVLLKNAAGKWNYSSLGNATAKESAPKSSASKGSAPKSEGPQLSIERLEIVDGKVRIGQSSGHSAGRERTYDNVNLVARNISAGSLVPFSLKASTPGGGSLKVEGTAGPLDQQDSARTPFDAQIQLDHANLAETGFLDADSGVGGTLDYDGKAKSDGRHVHSEGKAKATNLKIVKGGAAAGVPVAIDYKSDFVPDGGNGSLHANIHARNSTAVADGTLVSHGNDSVAHLKLQGKDMAVNDVEGLLPAFGVVMPSGASLQGGVLNMDLNAEGPLDRLVITGPLNISGTHLSGYNLGSKLGPLAQLSGVKSSSDTLIQTLSSGLRVAPEGLRADNIVLDIPEIGTFTGQGVVGSDNSLDFQMVLKLSNKTGSLLTNLGGTLGGIGKAAQSEGIAFLIKGKTSNPVFMPAMGGGLKTGLQNTLLGNQNQQQDKNQQQQQGVKGLLNDILNPKDPNKKKQ